MLNISTNQIIDLDGFKKITDYKITDIDNNIMYITDDEKVDYINLNNKTLMINKKTLKYDYLSKFENGVARVMVNQKYGLINEEGQYIIQPNYYKINKLDDLVYEVIIDKKTSLHGKISALYNINTHKITDFVYNSIETIGNHFYCAQKPIYKTVLIDSDFKEVASNEYDNYKVLNDQFIRVSKGYNKVGIINYQSRQILKPIYDTVTIENNYFIVRKGNKEGLYDFDGKEIIPLKNYLISEIKDGYVVYQKNKNSKKTLYNLQNNTIIENTYDDIRIMDNDNFLGHQNNHWWLIYSDNLKIHHSIFDSGKRTVRDYSSISHFKYGVAISSIGKEYILINNQLQELFRVNRIEEINDGIYLLEKDDDTSFIYNAKYQVKTKEYRLIKKEKFGYKIVSDGIGLLDFDCHEILKPIYNRIKFIDGYLLVSKDNLSGIYDIDGKEILPINYQIDHFKRIGNFLMLFKHSYPSEISLINMDGQVLLDNVDFASIQYINDELLVVNNYLVPVNELKQLYCLELFHRNSFNKEIVYKDSFDSLDARQQVINYIENIIEESINNLKSGRQKVINRK